MRWARMDFVSCGGWRESSNATAGVRRRRPSMRDGRPKLHRGQQIAVISNSARKGASSKGNAENKTRATLGGRSVVRLGLNLAMVSERRQSTPPMPGMAHKNGKVFKHGDDDPILQSHITVNIEGSRVRICRQGRSI